VHGWARVLDDDVNLDRRAFHRLLLSSAGLALAGCPGGAPYAEEDIARLAAQRREERARSGKGPYGPQRYRGYRGLAALPWFELDDRGLLRCVAEDVPPALDVHAHLGISVFLAPEIDLHARTPRVRYFLDCDAAEPPCDLDLDVYVNANFRPQDLASLRREALRQVLWGGGAATTHTIPNLLAEMDAVRVEKALILPIAFGLPWRDDLTERWLAASAAPDVRDRLLPACSVHPRDDARIEKLRRYAAQGARVVKLHPTMQRFFPDTAELGDLYEECARLGLVVFFHGGRAGIEPTWTQPYAVMRHYEGALRDHPEVSFVLGHAGARDLADAIPLARRHPNAWLEIHGQGVSALHELVERVGGERLLFGSDWPFYPLAASLAKVLMVTEGRPDLRRAILRGNAERLLGGA